ncbi:hypothetical protein [Streptomyces sp. NPDC005438]|uniref:hypothetical protein n=1 Tax=Streptomyces sp. NPDC005438 TaxID=3156880 RepID=UPI0033A19D21
MSSLRPGSPGAPEPAFPGLAGPGFDSRTVVLPPGSSRPYVPEEWADALVIVRYGELELECPAGGRRRFRTGATLWFAGLPLRRLHNPGAVRTVLLSVFRAEGRRER